MLPGNPLPRKGIAGRRSSPAASRAPLTLAMGVCVTLVVGTVSAVNLALPTLAASALHPSPEGLLWVVDGYVTVFACLLLPTGALADRVGRKGTLLAGLAVFVLGALLCALAPSTPVLIAGRTVGGAGAAAVLPTTLALLVEGQVGAGRRRAVAGWAAMTGSAAVAGNTVGGAAVELGGWRALFLVLVPLGVAAFAVSAKVAPTPERVHRPLPLASTALLTVGVFAVVYAVVDSAGHGPGSPPVLAAAALGLLALAGWTAHALRAPAPLLDPRLLVLPGVAVATVAMAVLFLGMFGLFYVNGQYMQYVKGYGPLEAGLRLLPMAGALLAGPRCSSWAEGRWGARWTVCAGLLVMAAGLGTVGTVSATSGYGRYALGAVLTALGCATATPPLSHTLMAALPVRRAATGASLQSLAREAGSALGVALTGSLLAHGFTARLYGDGAAHGEGAASPAAELARAASPAARASVLDAFTGALGVALPVSAALTALTAVVVALRFPRGGADAVRSGGTPGGPG